jgi:ubiquinone/menaquinone biosynthesis C-methylase UbiE
METQPESHRVARHYDRAAGLYRVGFWVLSLGAGSQLQRRAAAALELQPGSTVLDLGCGTGMLLPMLADQVGPAGRVIGVDISPKMIGIAAHLVAQRRLDHVELICDDVLSYQPPRPVDGVVFCLSLSTMPGPEAILRRAVEFLRPHGRLVIADSLVGPDAPSLANLYIRIKAQLVRSRPECRLIKVARETLEDVTATVHNHGIYTLLVGRRPAGQGILGPTIQSGATP